MTISVAVLVVTYKRPEGLSRLLQALGQQRIDANSFSPRIVVVDNDPDESAAPIVQGSACFWPVRYVSEPTPGIPAARTRALHDGLADDFVAFIDDDELPEPGWLATLLATQAWYGADGVTGPITYVPAGKVRAWVFECGFFDRRPTNEGAFVEAAATNNLLLRTSSLTRLNITRFDEDYRASGGSDTAFTSRLVRSGGQIVWTSAAVVREYVPADRLTPKWVLRRAYRTGNVVARVALRAPETTGSRRSLMWATVVAGGLVRVVIGCLGVVAATLRRDEVKLGRAVRRLFRGLGILGTACGHDYLEYAR